MANSVLESFLGAPHTYLIWDMKASFQCFCGAAAGKAGRVYRINLDKLLYFPSKASFQIKWKQLRRLLECSEVTKSYEKQTSTSATK